MLPCLLDGLHRTTSHIIHHTSLSQLMYACSPCVFVRGSYTLFLRSCASFGVSVRMCVWRGVVRQLTSCANDHLTAESHHVLQRHTALYCLCCHSDIVFTAIKCWYWLIVLASSSLFLFTREHTHTHTLLRFVLSFTYPRTHPRAHYHSFMVCVFFMASVCWSAPGPISDGTFPLS